MFSSFLMQNGTTFWPTRHTRRHNIPASIEHDWRKEKKKVFDESQKTVIGQALSSTRKLPVTGTFYLVKLNTFQTFLSLKRQSRSFYWSYKVLNFDLYIFRHFYICKGPTEMCEVCFLFDYIYIYILSLTENHDNIHGLLPMYYYDRGKDFPAFSLSRLVAILTFPTVRPVPSSRALRPFSSP